MSHHAECQNSELPESQMRNAIASTGIQSGRPLFSTVIFDADSTLAAIEGIDWLGALRGADVGQEIQRLTDRAMSGELPLQDVYAARLDVIKPTVAEIERLAAAYIATIEPGALELIAELRRADVRVVIVSGGLRAALLPMAAHLGVAANLVFAVDVVHDSAGNYVSLAPDQLLSRQDGKPLVVRSLKLQGITSAMIGDGSTDAAVAGVTNIFIAYTRVARRLPVVALANAEARDFTHLRSLLFEAST